ncbi:hypothetical protein [uncultured Methanobrevibacter sp.]|uniref:hypothetical protein n=1 Tax=uncultured Methanobrevibacter sp. TaxID=253161 RepID=UPI0025F1CFD2|nr:hypothetical protein [uncultured Methanobrevibacter sp.]
MYVGDLIRILEKCDENDEVTFIFDENSNSHWEREHGLKEVTMVNVCGYKINGKIAMSNGMSAKLLKGDEESIFIK